ncbi:MAG: D-tyrosyl-tRNA(Tyr) deacylase [Clostridiales bacterium]|nr:MAG: D-tyrosyl-tRNA(Tyr) deacylase [Clostridiales bacterium]
MRAICTVVKRARLTVEKKEIAQIGRGLLVFCGFSEQDTAARIEKPLKKIAGLRILADEDGRLNCSLADIGGEMLFVSNFTLYGDVHKGFRPSFTRSMKYEPAQALYQRALERLAEQGVRVRGGVFGGDMEIEALYDGPVNILIDSEDLQ